ncbi:MAG: magnesium transporter CorA family protein [Patescibacteria group bacterium]
MSHCVLIFEKETIREAGLEDIHKDDLIWADFQDPTEKDLKFVAELIGTGIPEIKEWFKPSQRPTLFQQDDYSAIFLGFPVASNKSIHAHPLLIFVSKDRNDIITLHRGPCLALEKVHSYNELRNLRVFKGGITNVLLAILEEVVDSFFDNVEKISDDLENIEGHMFDYKNSRNVMNLTFTVKKSLIYLNRALIADREVVMGIERQYVKFFDEERLGDFRDLSLKIVQLIEMMTTYRDIITSTIEIHLSAISNNLNVTMKKVTSWGALILVPSLIAGIFGMNFEYIPILHERTGFYISIILMVSSVYVLARYFQKKDWL